MLRCRTCLSVTAASHAMPLFQPSPCHSPVNANANANANANVCDEFDSSAPRLAALLAEVTQLQVVLGDKLPETICKACHTQLFNSQMFIKKARDSHNLLRNNLKKVSINGDCSPAVDLLSENHKKKLNCASKIDVVENVEGNFKDICEEMGITIDNELKIDESVINFQGEVSIIYNDKAVQVNFECEHHQMPHQDKSVHVNGVMDHDDNVYEILDSNGPENYDKINECEIKEEPEDYPLEYDPMEVYSGSSPEDSSLPVSQIKVEPLSECDALKFHQEVVCESMPIDSSVEQLDEDMKSLSPECEFLEEDIKPTEDELVAYAEKINHLENLEFKEMNNPHTEYEGFPDESLLNESQDSPMHDCILCNKSFKTKKKLKQHVMSEHSYSETIKCIECNMNFMTLIELDMHKSIHLPPVMKFQCVLCNIDFETDIQFKAHLGTHKEVILLKNGNEESTLCSKCNDSFGNLSELFSHIINVCGFSTPVVENIPNIPEHVKMERLSPTLAGQLKYKLDRKIKSEKKSDYVDELISKKLAENSCPHCFDKFSNLSSLRVHLKSHSNTFRKTLDRSFVCTLCMFKFKRKDHLIRHLVNVHRVSSENRRKKLMLLL